MIVIKELRWQQEMGAKAQGRGEGAYQDHPHAALEQKLNLSCQPWHSKYLILPDGT